MNTQHARDRIETRVQFSLSDLLLLTAAFAVIVVFDRLVTDTLIGFPWTFVVMGLLYIPKTALSLNAKSHRLVAIVGYAVICSVGLGLVGWVTILEGANDFMTPMGFAFGIPMAYLAVPTSTFLFDVYSNQRPSVGFLIIRSLVEIIVAFPIWLFVSFFIGAFMGFWWV